MTRKPFRRFLLAGAAEDLGRQLRGVTAAWADIAPTADLDDPTQRYRGDPFVLAGPVEPKR